MKQLKMRRESAPVKVRELPFGYAYEFFDGRREQIEDWLTLCFDTLIPAKEEKWFEDAILAYPDLCPEHDLFFVISSDTGRRVATMAAVCHGREGYIHMVAAAPDMRGQGIGHAMLRFALDMLEARGCTYSVLTTDDFRLAAIKTYLDAGFLPVIEQDPESDLRMRWERVLAQLHYTQKIQFLES